MAGLGERRAAMAAGLLILAFCAAALVESLGKSPTSDEPPHIASGLAYVAKGVFRGNPQHPPLLKELSGLSLLLGGVAWPKDPLADRFVRGEIPQVEQPEWDIGRALIAAAPDNVMFWARLPMLLVACLLGAMVYLFGSRMLGRPAALGAVFLYATSPVVLAHSYLVTTDVGVAAFTLLFLHALWLYLEEPSRRRMAWCGVALGVVLCVKFSAVLLLPVAALLLAIPVLPAWSRKPAVGRNDPCPCGSGKKYKACHGTQERTAASAARATGLGAQAGALALMVAIAAAVISVVYFLGNPLQWVDGLRLVNADHRINYQGYLAGVLESRHYSYFAAAYLLKEPLAAILLAGGGLVLLLRSRETDPMRKLFLLVPPAAMFAGATLWADNLGLRYIMPVIPFAHLLGGLALATLLTMPAKWGRPAAIALCVWLAVAMAGVYPDHLSYFNESACLLSEPGKIGLDGGSRCGTRWLDDSNVDWGQGLKQLKTWAGVHAGGRVIRHAKVFGMPAAAYGVRSEEVENAFELRDQPVPGALYAVSGHLVARVPVQESKSWLNRVEPVAVVGHGLYIYDDPKGR
jgi:hypothetical protein